MLQKQGTLGERIRARREVLDLSKAQLARKVGVSDSAVGQWERGDTKNLKLEVLFKVADTLGISARELAVGTPELPQDELELLQKYRGATKSWRLAVRLLLDVKDSEQGEVSEGINLLMAKIFAKPVSDARVARAYGPVPHAAVHEPRGKYLKKR